MSAGAEAPAPTTEPDPHRAGADIPTRIGRVLCLVRKLIDYGKELAATVQQRAAASGFVPFVRPFGTADLADILARITRGVRRAAALEARLSPAPPAAEISRWRPCACLRRAHNAQHARSRHRSSSPDH
jgi:hypothetical protein